MTKAIGHNLSAASFIPTRLSQNAQNHGGRCRRGKYVMLLAADVLPPVIQAMTTIVQRMTAMIATKAIDTIKKDIAMTHDTGNDTNRLHYRDLPLCLSSNRNSGPQLLRSTIPNGGSTMTIFVHKLDAACLNCSRFLGLDSEHPKLKLESIIDNSRASTILTKILQRSLV